MATVVIVFGGGLLVVAGLVGISIWVGDYYSEVDPAPYLCHEGSYADVVIRLQVGHGAVRVWIEGPGGEVSEAVARDGAPAVL
jgi:hypothetical protein